MPLAPRLRPALSALLLASGMLAAAASATPALTLRSPQVPLQIGSDGTSLQMYLNSIGESLNTLTSQLDLQSWAVGSSGTATFTIVVELAGYARKNNIGIYNANATTPVRYLVFPGAAAAGWTASCAFSSTGALQVSLYDNTNALQGVTNYTGVDRTNFGFYLEGPGGTFYSQDYRNAGGKPQIVAYQATGSYAGKWWECFEDLPYASGDRDFQDAILLLQSVGQTSSTPTTWGALKRLYQ